MENMEPNNAANPEIQAAVNAALNEQKKKKKKKTLIIIGIIAVIIILIGIIASGGEDKPSVNTPSDSGNAAASQQTDKDTSSIDNKENDLSQIKPGDVVTTKKVKVTYVSCDADYTDYNSYIGPANGNKVIRAEMEFENISSGDIFLTDFTCYADNKKCENYYGVNDYASPVLEKISSGRAFTGILYFEVPEDAKVIELETAFDWSNQKVVFIVE